MSGVSTGGMWPKEQGVGEVWLVDWYVRRNMDICHEYSSKGDHTL